MSNTDRKLALAGAVVLLLLLGGCAQIAVHSTVTSEGTIEEYRINVTMTRQAYGFFESAAEDEGYDNVRAYFLEGVNESARENVEFEQEFQRDQVFIDMRISDFDPSTSDAISVRTEDDELVYRDTTFLNESATETESDSELASSIMSGLAVDYYLTMPGEITDSNADEVDGNKAEWHASGADSFTDTRIYARSKNPTGTLAPGFGGVVAGIALTLLTVMFALRSRRD